MPEPSTPETQDSYVLSPDAICEPPATLGDALRKIGPGMILAASIVGTGELIATTHAGATAGFTLLWLVFVSCFIKVFVQIELGRHALVSGETTLTSFARLPGPGRLFPWWWLIMMLATQAQIAAMIGGIGQTLHMAFPLVDGLERPALVWAVAVTIATTMLLVFGTYRLIERAMTLLVVVFTFMTVACVILLQFNAEFAFGWGDIAEGLTFRIPLEQAAIMAAFTMIGITGVGASELVSYPYWCIEKGYARNVGPADGSEAWLRRARGWLSVMKLDAWISMAVYTLATLAFFLLGAAVLHSGDAKGLPGSVGGMLTSLTNMYAPVLGTQLAVIFITIGAFAVLFSTLVSATAANARLTTDFLHVTGFIGSVGPAERFRWVRGLCVALMLLGLTLFAFFPNPVLMVMIGGFAQAVSLPLIAAAAIYMRYCRTDRRLTPGLVWDILLWLSLVAFLAAAIYGIWSQVKHLL